VQRGEGRVDHQPGVERPERVVQPRELHQRLAEVVVQRRLVGRQFQRPLERRDRVRVPAQPGQRHPAGAVTARDHHRLVRLRRQPAVGRVQRRSCAPNA
jgi:hypothetical protein